MLQYQDFAYFSSKEPGVAVKGQGLIRLAFLLLTKSWKSSFGETDPSLV
jgi:hypothetical protein